MVSKFSFFSFSLLRPSEGSFVSVSQRTLSFFPFDVAKVESIFRPTMALFSIVQRFVQPS